MGTIYTVQIQKDELPLIDVVEEERSEKQKQTHFQLQTATIKVNTFNLSDMLGNYKDPQSSFKHD